MSGSATEDAPPPPVRHPVYAGERVRALRRRFSLSQADMAGRLALSVSYLSQIESGDRPVTRSVIAALARAFPLDWVDVTPEESSAHLVGALQAAADPSVPAALLGEDAVMRAIRRQPLVMQRMAALHIALQRSQEQLRALDDSVDSGSSGAAPLPWEEVRDWFHASGNYVDALDMLGERLASELAVVDAPMAVLVDRLRAAHGVGLRIEATAEGHSDLRVFDPATRTLTLDRSLPPETKLFQVAHQLVQFEARDVIDDVVRAAPPHSDAARSLLRMGLANYGASALVMPYGLFRAEARRLRHDVDRLSRRFGASFEQTCHRLSTLQRPGAAGVPVFFCRVDMAGNITKRHSATRLQFARFGGACPLWIVHEAVAIPDRILVQLAETPDGVRYVSMAKGLVKPSGSYTRPSRRYAVALGCEIAHAAAFVYADQLDTADGRNVTPIGVSCRICPRADCDQRAFPPTGAELHVDPDIRRVVPYELR